MGPVLYTLSVFGINMHKKVKYPCYKSGVANCGWCVYNTVVLLLGVYQQRNPTELHLIFNIQNTLWIEQNVGQYAVFYVNIVISSKFCAFLISYQEYINEYTRGNLSIKRIAYKCVTLHWCLLLLTFAFEAYCIHDYDAYGGIVHWPLQNNSNFRIVMQFIYTAFMLHMSVVWLVITLIISLWAFLWCMNIRV